MRRYFFSNQEEFEEENGEIDLMEDENLAEIVGNGDSSGGVPDFEEAASDQFSTLQIFLIFGR